MPPPSFLPTRFSPGGLALGARVLGAGRSAAPASAPSSSTSPSSTTATSSSTASAPAPSPSPPRVLVAFHGNGLNKATWEPVLARLDRLISSASPSFPPSLPSPPSPTPSLPHLAVSVDLRGHGESRKPGAYASFAEVSGDVLEALAAAAEMTADPARARFVILAHSMGAHGTLVALSRGPAALVDRVDLAFLVEPIMSLITPPPESLRPPLPGQTVSFKSVTPFSEGTRKRRAVFPSLEDARAKYKGRGLFATWPDESLDAYLADAFRPVPPPAEGVQLTCAPETEAVNFESRIDLIWPDLPRVRRPCVVVSGAKSSHVPTATLRKAAGLLSAELVVLENGDHCPHMGLPDEVAAHLFRAMRALPAKPVSSAAPSPTPPPAHL